MSFSPVIRKGVLNLPNTGGLQLSLPTGDVALQFDQEILNYRPFDVALFDYSLRSYFMLAKDILKITPDQMIANTLNFFVESTAGKQKYDVLIDDINKQMHANLAYPQNKQVSEVSRIIQQQFPGKIYDILFETYIQRKTENETKARMQKFYNVTGFFQMPITDRIDEMISPRIKFRQNLPQHINLAAVLGKASGPAIDTTTVFESAFASAILNYKGKSLEITFNGHLNHTTSFKFSKIVDYDSKTNQPKLMQPTALQAEGKDLKQLVLRIDEDGVTLSGIAPDERRYQILDKRWE